MLSSKTTLILSTFLTFLIGVPLAFASPAKGKTKLTGSQRYSIQNLYHVSKSKKLATQTKHSAPPVQKTIAKLEAMTVSNYAVSAGRDEIDELVWEETDGLSTASGALIGPHDEHVDLWIEVDARGQGEISLEGDAGVYYQAVLSQDRMEIVSNEAGSTVSEVWYRPGGDLLDFLDRKAENAGSGATPRHLEGMSFHETARNAVFAVAQKAGGAFSSLAQRFETAETVYANWKEATTSEREMVRYATLPVPIEPNEPPARHCTYPDDKTAVATENTLKIVKLANLTVRSAKVKVSAFCEDQGGCLKAQSKVNFGSVNSQEDDGSFGCPQDGTEISGEEFKAGVLTFEGSADVGRGCARNYDRTDIAEAFTAELAVDGVVEASIKGTAATGDGVAGRSHIQGKAVVCYEDDPWFDDLQDVMLSGSAQSTLD